MIKQQLRTRLTVRATFIHGQAQVQKRANASKIWKHRGKKKKIKKKDMILILG